MMTKRRDLFKVMIPVAAVAACELGAAEAKQHGVILNFRRKGLWDTEGNAQSPEREYIGGKCFVDGIEIRCVWYVDTAAGIVRTGDTRGDGRQHFGIDENGNHGVESKTIRGVVQLIPRPPQRVN